MLRLIEVTLMSDGKPIPALRYFIFFHLDEATIQEEDSCVPLIQIKKRITNEADSPVGSFEFLWL